ncbi:MAG: transposase [Armatimonadetes bacterium]|nr:transposase [Armatimonadota bacterium]
MRLVRMLYERGYEAERIRKLFRAMELMMVLPSGLEDEFARELIRYEEEQAMPVLTQFERRALRKGRQEGRQEGQAEALLHLLERKFGQVDAASRERVVAAETGDLRRWLERVLTAESLEEVFA